MTRRTILTLVISAACTAKAPEQAVAEQAVAEQAVAEQAAEQSDPATPEQEPEPEPAPTTRLRRLVVDDSGGCVSDDDERLLCWGATFAADEQPRTRADLRAATSIDLGQGDAKIVDVSLRKWGPLCVLYDDGELRCRRGSGDPTSQATPADARRLRISDAWSYDRDQRCVLVGDRLQCLSEVGAIEGVLDFDFGKFSACGLRADGSRFCWSYRHQSPTAAPAPRTAQTIEGAVQLEFEGRLCVRTDPGEVWCTDPEIPAFSIGADTPLSKVPFTEAIADIAVGPSHLCAVTRAGAVWCQGGNGYAQLGAGDSQPHAELVEVPLPGPALEIAVSGPQSCALVGDAPWCWGTDGLGRGPAPTDVASLELAASKLLLDDDLSCAKLTNGELRCWGARLDLAANEHGGIVAASRPTRTVAALDVTDVVGDFVLGEQTLVTGLQILQHLDDDPIDTDWRKKGVELVASNGLEMCLVLAKNGQLECFENDEDGRWVRNRRVKSTSKVTALELSLTTIFVVASGRVREQELVDQGVGRWVARAEFDDVVDVVFEEWSAVGCLLRSTGAVHCWEGDDPPFELDLHDAVELITGDFGLCARTRAGAVRCTSLETAERRLTTVIESGAVELAAGTRHWCARIDADGSARDPSDRVECHGDNRLGQLGKLGDNVMLRPTPIAVRR